MANVLHFRDGGITRQFFLSPAFFVALFFSLTVPFLQTVPAFCEPIVTLDSSQVTDHIVFAVKEGHPLILIDVDPDMDTITQLTPSGKKEYIFKLALLKAVKDAVPRQAYKGMNSFPIKLVVVTEYDNYEQPNWFSADVVSNLVISRDKILGLTSQKINAMSLPDLDKYITVDSLELGYLE